MTATTWIVMIAILSFVWGGFAFVLRKAIRSEAGKAPTQEG